MSDEEAVISAVWNVGIDYEWTPGPQHQERLDAELAYHIKSESHYWIALTMYHLSDQSMKEVKTGQVHMDQENLMRVNMGCYICEEPYSERLETRRCKGQPPGSRFM